MYMRFEKIDGGRSAAPPRAPIPQPKGLPVKRPRACADCLWFSSGYSELCGFDGCKTWDNIHGWQIPDARFARSEAGACGPEGHHWRYFYRQPKSIWPIVMFWLCMLTALAAGLFAWASS